MTTRAAQPFDQYAEQYDSWFLKNPNVLESEVRLLKRCLAGPGKTLSVGCGSGLFEHILRTRHGIDIRFGVEPTARMGGIAAKRGMLVSRGTAEALPVAPGAFDTALLNGILSYLGDPRTALAEARRVLRAGGVIVVTDVPAESSYGLLYRLGGDRGTWDDPYLRGVAPKYPYPAEFLAAARWRTTEEKAQLLRGAGFVDLEYAQTLTRHPKYSNELVEDPVEGFDRGDYVAIVARKGGGSPGPGPRATEETE